MVSLSDLGAVGIATPGTAPEGAEGMAGGGTLADEPNAGTCGGGVAEG